MPAPFAGPAGVDLGLGRIARQGPVVPVIRKADEISSLSSTACSKELCCQSPGRRRGAGRDDGTTFTISNMGMLDVENFMAIINPGEPVILAVSGSVRQTGCRDDASVICSIMKMTSSSDHPLIDGAIAARSSMKIQKPRGYGTAEIFDVVVVGAGQPGGDPAAIRVLLSWALRRNVRKVATGGYCVYLGCIPTKASHRQRQTPSPRSRLAPKPSAITVKGARGGNYAASSGNKKKVVYRSSTVEWSSCSPLMV